MLLVSLMLLLFAPATPVIDAVGAGHRVGHEQDGVDAVAKALAAGGSANERGGKGWTPLMQAAFECRPRIVKLLLDHGADPGLRASGARATDFADHGQTALTIAAGCFIARRRAELAPGRGMPPSYVDYELAAPLAMVRLLIAGGADVNSADADGRTPLMMAAMQGWAGVVRELLAAKANVNARDREGRLAIDYADPGDRDVTGLLRGAGSQPASGRSGRTVCDADRALARRGYDAPITDCIAGQQLRAIVMKFQRDSSLPPTGELDAATRKALDIR